MCYSVDYCPLGKSGECPQFDSTQCRNGCHTDCSIYAKEMKERKQAEFNYEQYLRRE